MKLKLITGKKKEEDKEDDLSEVHLYTDVIGGIASSGREKNKAECDLVQNLIRQCIDKYMTKKETQDFLYKNHNIKHFTTGTVWELLEAGNQEFFKAYYRRLTVTAQIFTLNSLLVRALMGMTPPSSAAASSSSTLPSSSIWELLEAENQEFHKAYLWRLKGKERIFTFNSLLAQQTALTGITPPSSAAAFSSSTKPLSSGGCDVDDDDDVDVNADNKNNNIICDVLQNKMGSLYTPKFIESYKTKQHPKWPSGKRGTMLVTGGAILLVGMVGIFVVARKCDNFTEEIRATREVVLSELKAARKDLISELKSARTDVVYELKFAQEGWASAGYPSLFSLFSFRIRR